MLKEIMKRAHELAKGMEGHYHARLSLGLRLAWKEYKEENELKNIEVAHDEIAIYGPIEKETDKAVLFIGKWVPKSQISNIDRENNVIVMKDWLVKKNGWEGHVRNIVRRLEMRVPESKQVDWRKRIAVYADCIDWR